MIGDRIPETAQDRLPGHLHGTDAAKLLDAFVARLREVIDAIHQIRAADVYAAHGATLQAYAGLVGAPTSDGDNEKLRAHVLAAIALNRSAGTRRDVLGIISQLAHEPVLNEYDVTSILQFEQQYRSRFHPHVIYGVFAKALPVAVRPVMIYNEGPNALRLDSATPFDGATLADSISTEVP